MNLQEKMYSGNRDAFYYFSISTPPSIESLQLKQIVFLVNQVGEVKVAFSSQNFL